MKSRSSKQILRILRNDGWEIVRQKGSHLQLQHTIKPGTVTVPYPKKNIPEGTIKNILKLAGLLD